MGMNDLVSPGTRREFRQLATSIVLRDMTDGGKTKGSSLLSGGTWKAATGETVSDSMRIRWTGRTTVMLLACFESLRRSCGRSTTCNLMATLTPQIAPSDCLSGTYGLWTLVAALCQRGAL